MRILIIPSWYPTEESPLSGIFFWEQAKSSVKSGHRVQVLVPPGLGYREKLKLHLLDFDQVSSSLYKGLQTARIEKRKTGPARNLLSWLYFFCFAQFFLPQLLKDVYVPDIIHAHGVLHGGALATYLGEKWKVPVVLTEHNSAFVRDENLLVDQRRYITCILSKIKNIRVVGNSLKAAFGPLVPHRKIAVVGNSIDSSFFTLPVKGKIRIPFYFSALAMLAENKGIDLLIKAFAKAFSHYDNVFLIIGGDGNILDLLKKVATENGVREKVHFLGPLTKMEVRDLFWKAHVHLSASYFETFGVNMIEALSCGVPVVATKSGGPELYINSGNGKLVPKGDVEELSKAMSSIYNNYDDYDPVFIREECIKKYDEMNFNKRLTAIYNSLIEKEITGK